MLAGKRADIEQPGLDCFEPVGIETESLDRPFQLFFAFARLDDGAVERGESVDQQRMVRSDPIEPTRGLAEMREDSL